MRATIVFMTVWSLGIATIAPALEQTALTYQGQLKDGGGPATGSYDLVFRLFAVASGGSAIGFPVTISDHAVANGLFTISLDFGASPFDGSARWLQIEVRPGTSTGSYTVLNPRQPLTATPYALYALDGPGGSGPWDANGTNIHNTNTGNVGIGTNTPAAPLHVTGDIRSDGAFGLSAHNPNNIEAVAALGWFNDVARIRVGGNGPGAGGGLDIQKTGDRSLMRIYDSGDAWIRGGIEASGDVITTAGSLRSFNPDNASAEVFLGWGSDGSGDDVARIRIGGDGPGATNGLDIQRTSNVSLLRILNNGSVGIGTSYPSHTLSVVGNAYIHDTLGVGFTNRRDGKLHVDGGTDAEPGGGGFIVSGNVDGPNISIDNNEIMARNDGTLSTLYLNADGGPVRIGQFGIQPPYAYGRIRANGVVISASSNVTAIEALEGTSALLIQVAGGVASSDICVATDADWNSEACIMVAQPSEGKLLVNAWCIVNGWQRTDFSFVIYRP